MATTEEKVKVSLSVDQGSQGAATTAVKTLKQQLKEAVAEAQRLSSVDMGSAEAVAAQKKVAGLKDEIGDLNKRFEAFNPDAKLKAIGQVGQGIAGGFAAAQGAMALFGNESEDLQKTLLKVQAAMALSQGVDSIMELGDSFKNLQRVAIDAFNKIKGALAGIGIGALVVAFGLIVAYWDDIKEAVSGVGAEQRKLVDTTNEQLKVEREKLTLIGDQENILRLQGKSEKEILDLKIAQTKQIGAATLLALKAQEELLTSKIVKKAKDETEGGIFGWVNSLIFGASEGDLKKDAEAVKSLRASFQKTLDEIAGFTLQEQKIEKDAIKASDDQAKEAAAKRKKAREEEEAWLKRARENQQADDKTFAEFERNEADRKWQEEKDGLAERRRQAIESKEHDIENEQERADATKAIREQEMQAKYDAAHQLISIAESINTMAGNNARVNKALAIATATIDTYMGATKAFGQGGAYGFISAAAVIAAGLANVYKIANTPIPGGGGGGSAAPSISIAAPVFKPKSQDTEGAKDLNAGSNIKNTPQRVYVVEKDITDVQKRVSVSEARAKF